MIIINSFLLLLNINQGNNDFTIIILAQIITLFIFLLFNFPKAKIFLGDSGAYLFGSLTALNVIKMNNLNENISSFFFCILLFYLFFEVFFSFFRKIMQKKNPLKPDRLHLHMVLYNFLKDFKKIKDGNFEFSPEKKSEGHLKFDNTQLFTIGGAHHFVSFGFFSLLFFYLFYIFYD